MIKKVGSINPSDSRLADSIQPLRAHGVGGVRQIVRKTD